MPIEVDKVDLPARWASYFVNGDASGFDAHDNGAADKRAADDELGSLHDQGWRIVSADGEPIFSGSWGCDLLTYTIHRAVKREPVLPYQLQDMWHSVTDALADVLTYVSPYSPDSLIDDLRDFADLIDAGEPQRVSHIVQDCVGASPHVAPLLTKLLRTAADHIETFLASND